MTEPFLSSNCVRFSSTSADRLDESVPRMSTQAREMSAHRDLHVPLPDNIFYLGELVVPDLPQIPPEPFSEPENKALREVFELAYKAMEEAQEGSAALVYVHEGQDLM